MTNVIEIRATEKLNIIIQNNEGANKEELEKVLEKFLYKWYPKVTADYLREVLLLKLIENYLNKRG